MWNRRLAAAIAFGIAASTAQAADLDSIRSANELKIAVYREFPPFSSAEGGAVTGVDVDIAKAIANAVGVPLFLKQQSPGGSVNDDLRNAVWKGHFLDGQIVDIMLHIPVSKELADENDKVVLVAPYYQESVVFATKAGAFTTPVVLDTFRTRRIGVVTGTVSDMILLTHQNGVLINNVIHYKTPGEAAQGFKRGEVSALLGDRSEQEDALNGASVAYEETPVHERTIGRSTWTVGAAIKAGSDKLVQEVNAVMARLLADGTIKKIFADHGLNHTNPQ